MRIAQGMNGMFYCPYCSYAHASYKDAHYCYERCSKEEKNMFSRADNIQNWRKGEKLWHESMPKEHYVRCNNMGEWRIVSPGEVFEVSGRIYRLLITSDRWKKWEEPKEKWYRHVYMFYDNCLVKGPYWREEAIRTQMTWAELKKKIISPERYRPIYTDVEVDDPGDE
jgi:hypothetical protein